MKMFLLEAIFGFLNDMARVVLAMFKFIVELVFYVFYYNWKFAKKETKQAIAIIFIEFIIGFGIIVGIAWKIIRL